MSSGSLAFRELDSIPLTQIVPLYLMRQGCLHKKAELVAKQVKKASEKNKNGMLPSIYPIYNPFQFLE